MTDKEKAEEYSIGKAHEHYHFLFEENNGSPVDFAKLCFLDGLAEGRKDRNCVNCSNHGKQFEVMKLEKENARLSKMLEIAMTDALSQSHYAECNGSIYGLNCSNIEEYRAKLEKRVEKEE